MSVERRLDAIEYQLGRIAEATTEFRQDLAEIKGMIREQAETTKQQAEVAKQQAETARQQAETVARLVGIVER
ncbi:MAG: hypothetical protein ACFE0J_02610, partial [Elainellaceae cyanobacterium]